MARNSVVAYQTWYSPKVKNIFVAPGNAGTSLLATNIPLSKTQDIIKWIEQNSIDLVVIGPDNYLKEGMVDKLLKIKIPVFGPTRAAAKIEFISSSFGQTRFGEPTVYPKTVASQ